MNITLKRSSGYELIFEAENVKISEDIESREYHKDENGKIDFKIPPKRDIKTDAVVQFVELLDDIIYFRVADFDSSSLIERLFEKLPSDVAVKLSKKIKIEYGQEDK